MFDVILHKYLRIPYSLHVRTDTKPKKPIATVVFLHGLGESSQAWDRFIDLLPENIRVISIDLLGFGESPKPRKIRYNIAIQAHSVARTLVKYGLKQKVVLVGHSMGSLTAIEIAKRYPLAVKGLVLCCPPIYNASQRKTILPENNKILTNFYQYAIKNPEVMTNLAPVAAKLKITAESFTLTKDNVDIYMAALESSILHQTSYKDIMKIAKPIRIINGRFDPLVIKKNIKKVALKNDNISVTTVNAGHELTGPFQKPVTEAIKNLL